MALELRPTCERCGVDLPPSSTDARICTYECTYCAACVDALADVCPNCGGGFAPRPIRPATAWRPGLSTAHQPPSTEVHTLAWTEDEVAALVARLHHVPPEER